MRIGSYARWTSSLACWAESKHDGTIQVMKTEEKQTIAQDFELDGLVSGSPSSCEVTDSAGASRV